MLLFILPRPISPSISPPIYLLHLSISITSHITHHTHPCIFPPPHQQQQQHIISPSSSFHTTCILPSMRVTALIAAPYPHHIAWISNNKLHILDLDAHLLKTRTLSNPVSSILLSNNSWQLFTVHSPPHLRVHSWRQVASRLIRLAPRTTATYDSPPRILHVARAERAATFDAVLTTNTALVRVLRAEQNALVTHVIPHTHPPLCACIHPQTRLLAVANTNATIHLYSISTRISSFSTHHNATSLLFCHPPPEKPGNSSPNISNASQTTGSEQQQQLLLIAATLNASILIYRIPTSSSSSSTESAQSSKPLKPFKTLSIPQPRQNLLCIARSPCHNYLAVAAANAKILLYPISNLLNQSQQTPLCTYLTHNHPITTLTFTADSRHLLAGCANGAVYRFGVLHNSTILGDHHDSQSLSTTAASTQPSTVVSPPFTPLNHVLMPQMPCRELLYMPAVHSPLQCRLCAQPFDADKRKPVLCAQCAQTHACDVCHRRILATDSQPKCTLCRLSLQSYTYNYQLVSTLSPTITKITSFVNDSGKVKNYIDISRISFIEAPEFLFTHLDTASYYSATMDGSAVLLRLPHRYRRNDSNPLVAALLIDEKLQTQAHLRNADALTGPNVAHVYAVSRLPLPDYRIVTICEPLPARTLANWTHQAQRNNITLSQDLLVSLCLNLTNLLRFLHQSKTAAAHALSPQNLAFVHKLDPNHPAAPPLKLLDVGGAVPMQRMSESTRPFSLAFLPYTAPELYGVDAAAQSRHGTPFQRACRADMYALGVLMWQIAAAQRPFHDVTPVMLMAAVASHDSRPGHPPDNLPPPVQELIVECWRKEPEKRPDVLQACRVLEQVPTAPPVGE